ncbi:MAG: gfo/Idh/MocA family oxidoreductase, partial [Armatimonadota bacterium]
RLGYVDQGQTPNTLVAHYDFGDADLIFEVRGLPTPGLVAKGAMPGIQIGNIVRGEKGYVAMSSDYGKAAAFDLEGNAVATYGGGGNHFANFVAAAKAGRPDQVNAPVLEGHISSALCHLGNVSYKLGSDRDASSVELKHPEMIDAYERMAQHLATNGVDLTKTRVRVGPRIEIDAKRESARDAKADALFTRDYRSGFVVPGKI